MTMPGPIQMLPIPNVSPGGIQQAPGFAEQVAPALSALGNILALRQRKAELDQQQQELQFRVQAQKQESENRIRMGQTLQQTLPAAMTDVQAFAGPLMNLPTGLPGVTVPTKMPVATTSVLGTTIRNADPTGLALASPYLQSAVAAEFDAKAARTAAQNPVNRNTEKFISGGFYQLLDKNTGRSAPVLDEQGNPVAADAQVNKEQLDQFVDTRTNQIVYLPRRAGALPSYYQKSGNITDGERRDAKLFTRAARAYRIARRQPPVSADIVTQMAASAQRDPQSKFLAWIGRTKLPNDQRRSLMAWYQVLTSGVYGYSGAAITVGEFLGEMTKIPTTADDFETIMVKNELVEGDISALRRGGRRALEGSDEDMSIGDEDLPEEYR